MLFYFLIRLFNKNEKYNVIDNGNTNIHESLYNMRKNQSVIIYLSESNTMLFDRHINYIKR